MSENQFDIYDRLLHLLGLLLGDLAEPLPLGAHNLALTVSDELLVILIKEQGLEIINIISNPQTHIFLGYDGQLEQNSDMEMELFASAINQLKERFNY